jgi:hypothetical protein
VPAQQNHDSLQPLLSGGVAGTYLERLTMQDNNRWRQHVARSLKRAGVNVKTLPTGQSRIEGNHYAITVSDLCRINFTQLQTLCGG